MAALTIAMTAAVISQLTTSGRKQIKADTLYRYVSEKSAARGTAVPHWDAFMGAVTGLGYKLRKDDTVDLTKRKKADPRKETFQAAHARLTGATDDLLKEANDLQARAETRGWHDTQSWNTLRKAAIQIEKIAARVKSELSEYNR